MSSKTDLHPAGQPQGRVVPGQNERNLMTAPTVTQHQLVGRATTIEHLHAAAVGSSFRYLNNVTYIREADDWLRTNRESGGETRITTEDLLERGRHGRNYIWTNYVETPTAEAPVATVINLDIASTMVGQQITRDAVRTAPEGAAFASPNGQRTYTKNRRNRWEVDGQPYGWDDTVCRNLVREGARWTVWPGATVVAEGVNLPAVGAQVTVEGLTALPLGSVISDRSDVGGPTPSRSWRKTNEGWVHYNLGERGVGNPLNPGNASYASLGMWYVHTIGDGTAETAPPPPAPVLPDGITIGMQFDPADRRINDLPVGSQIEYRGMSNSLYERTEDGWHYIRNGAIRERFARADGRASFSASTNFLVRYGPVAPATAPPAGEGLTEGCRLTPEQFDALPVGAVVRDLNGTGASYTKQADDRWTDRGRSTNYGRTLRSMVDSGSVRFSALPDVASPLPAVGTRLTHVQMDALPVGSIVQFDDNYRTFRKDRLGWWVREEDSREYAQYRLTEGRYRFVSGPADAPVEAPAVVVPVVPEGCVNIGETFRTTAQVTACPVGTKITRLNHDDNRRYIWKVGDNSWSEDGPEGLHTWSDPRIGRNYHIVVSYPTVVNPDQDAAVEAVKAQVRAVVDGLVAETGNWDWVRDGAFILLGINPMPAVDSSINWGSVFGLPVGSVVRVTIDGRSRLYQTSSNNVRVPDHLAGDETVSLGTAVADRTTQVQIITLGAHTPVTYTGRNDFLRQLWVRQREQRGVHRYCGAVERALTEAGLTDPGDAPDEVVATNALVADYVFPRSLTHADVARLSALALGSIITGPGLGLMLRTNAARSGWARVDNLAEVTPMVGLAGVQIVAVS